MAKNTIAVNKLTLCHKRGGGKAMNLAPDVCWTRIGKYIVPIPYPNLAKALDLIKGSKTVKADGGNMIGIVSMGDLVREIIAEQESTIVDLEKYISG